MVVCGVVSERAFADGAYGAGGGARLAVRRSHRVALALRVLLRVAIHAAIVWSAESRESAVARGLDLGCFSQAESRSGAPAISREVPRVEGRVHKRKRGQSYKSSSHPVIRFSLHDLLLAMLCHCARVCKCAREWTTTIRQCHFTRHMLHMLYVSLIYHIT